MVGMTESYPIKVGFLSPPSWFDPTAHEFGRIAPPGVGAMQTVLPAADFRYTVEEMRRAVPLYERCTVDFAACGVRIVGQVGTPFTYLMEGGPDRGRSLCTEIENIHGVAFLMMGLSIVDALRHLRAERVAVAATYYDSAWETAFDEFITGAGLAVSGSATFTSQGLLDLRRVEDQHDWVFAEETLRKSVLLLADSTPEAEALVITGAGVRTLGMVETLEAEIGIPIVGADLALYWAVLRAAGRGGPGRGHGRLLAGLKAPTSGS